VATDANGVNSCYGTGPTRSDFEEDFRSDSYRWDFIGLGANNFVSLEATIYWAWANPSDDEAAGQIGGGEHHDGSNPRCYVLGVDNNSGDTRLRVEDSHPDYEEVMNGQKGVGLSGKFVGFRYIKRNLSSGVLLEIWQDTGDNESKPSNSWKRILTHTDNEYNWRNPPSDHMFLFRIDEGNLGDIKFKWWMLRTILDNDPTTPFTGGGGGTGGAPPSGGTGGSGGTGSGGSGCGCGGGGTGTGGEGSGSGGENTGGDTPAEAGSEPEPVEVDIYTVQQVFTYKWNIIAPPNSCNSTEPTDNRQLDEYLRIDSTVGKYFDMFGAALPTPKPLKELMVATKVGIFCAMDKSVLNGQIFRQFVPTMRRVGAPPGDIFCKIYNEKFQLVYTCPNSIIANSLGLNDTQPIFQDLKNIVDIKLGWRIMFEYTGGDVNNYVRMAYNNTEEVDGIKTMLTYYVGGKWYIDPKLDFPVVLSV
jgi:hypothetical protein